MSFLRNITTGKDNQTHDLVRVIMAVNALLLPPVLLLGVGVWTWGIVKGHPTDVQPLFTAVLSYEGGVGMLLTTGAASLLIKKTTEPDGTSSNTAPITRGQQPDVNVNTTIVNPA